MNKKFLILGGYGNTGRLIAERMLQETDARVILAGRNINRAETCAALLNQKFKGGRVSGIRADAADPQSLRSAFHQADMVIAASSTLKFVKNVASAALEAKIDYLDTQLSSPVKLEVLKAMSRDIERAGSCFITDGGFHPGVPAAMIRYAATHFDRITAANVGSTIQINWKSLGFSDATLDEMIEEFRHYQPVACKNGKWEELGWNAYHTFDFGPIFGERYCVPMFLEELRSLPETFPSLKETGFFVGGFNWVTDYIVIPLAIAALRIWPEKAAKPLGRLFEYSLKTFAKPPYGTLLLLQAKGWKDGKQKQMRMLLSHEDGYALTAIPVAACLLQYLEGGPKPGLWFQAHFPEPERFLRDMERLGVNVGWGSTPPFV